MIRTYRRGQASAVKFTDFLTRRQFRRTALYNEVYRRIGLDCQISKGLPGHKDLVTSISMLRRGRDFSERDRLVLDLLQPHLNQAYRNALAFDGVRKQLAALRDGVEALDRGLVILDGQGRVVIMTRRARRLIEDYFDTLPPSGLPATLAWYVRTSRRPTGTDDDAPPPRAPLTRDLEGRRLVVRLLSTSDQTVLILDERHTSVRAAALAPLGLSARETEVLTWLAEGKTNPEIALILGTSPRTVDKHLERVFRKLGVETRTAAAALALSLSQT